MGIIRKKSILSGVSGRIGNTVVLETRNTIVVKEAPARPKKGAYSTEQAKQRAFFKYTKNFLLGIGYDVPRIGYQLPRKAGMTKPNAAMQHLMLHVVKGKYPNFSIDFSKVQLSSPIHQIDACWKGVCTAGEGTVIEVTWEQNPFPGKMTRSNDNAVIVFYDETWERNIYREMHARVKIPRSALKWNYTGFPKLVGHNIHCWIFFVSADGKRVSQTEYLGMVTMKE